MKRLILIVFLVSSCSATMLPIDQRSIKAVKQTELSKSAGYTSAIAYISRNFGDSREVVKYSSKSKGLIVLKGNTRCNIFRQSGDINDYFLQFTLTIMLSKKRVDLIYQDLFIIDELGYPVTWDYNQLSSDSKVEESRKCLQPMIDDIAS